MLRIFGRQPSAHCDGRTRRHFLQIGGLALGGASLPQLLAAEQSVGGVRGRVLPHKAVIMIYLSGGPSHQDMYDLKMAGDSWQLSTDFDKCCGCGDLRASAATGDDDGSGGDYSITAWLS